MHDPRNHASSPPAPQGPVVNNGLEQITPRLRRLGNIYELDGEPLRKIVGRPRDVDRLTRLEQLNANLRSLLGKRWPEPDAARVRKFVGKAR